MDLGLIGLILAAALLGPALTLLTRGAIPAVVGELLAGVILGTTGFQIIDPSKSDLSLLYGRHDQRASAARAACEGRIASGTPR